MSHTPEDFLCPISRLLMEHPFITTGGNTYEHSAISTWFEVHNTDPQTNARLPSLMLIPNLLLRSQIQEWIALNPEAAAASRNLDAVPPPRSDSSGLKSAGVSDLDSILQFVGESRIPNKAERAKLTPAPLQLMGHTYEFCRAESLMVRRRGTRGADGQWVCMPPGTNSLFTTLEGVIFYDCEEVHEARMACKDGDESLAVCRYGASCSDKACLFSHPFPCSFGFGCRDKVMCRKIHPEAGSVVPLGTKFPLNKGCKHGPACSNAKCHFAHPLSRVVVKRGPKQLTLTHTHDLALLPSPLPLDLGSPPPGATKFSFQGEFALYFTPYAGAWAKEEHFQSVAVHHYSPKTQTYCVREYELEGHYCNAAVGCERFFALSWWPYEEENIRTIWEWVRDRRATDKASRSQEAVLKSQEAKIAALKSAKVEAEAKLGTQLKQSQKHVKSLQRHAADQKAAQLAENEKRKAAQAVKQADYENRQAAKIAKQVEYADRKAAQQAAQQIAYEDRQRRREMEAESMNKRRRAQAISLSERLRMRDPIHLYALDGDDWNLVLDYHKGANKLQLEPARGGRQRLLVTEKSKVKANNVGVVVEKSTVYTFELTASLPGVRLPVVPGRLCSGF